MRGPKAVLGPRVRAELERDPSACYRAVARRCGCSVPYVAKIAADMGLPPRKLGRRVSKEPEASPAIVALPSVRQRLAYEQAMERERRLFEPHIRSACA